MWGFFILSTEINRRKAEVGGEKEIGTWISVQKKNMDHKKTSAQNER